MDNIKLIGDAVLDGKIVEGHILKEQKKLDQGAVGWFLGSSDSIPRNVAAIIALASSLTLVIAVLFWADTGDFGPKEAITSLSSLVTLTVGFLFGRSSKD